MHQTQGMDTTTKNSNFNTITIADIDETILREILSYFTLIELNDSIRKVSKSFHNISQHVKQFHFNTLSRDHSIVQIIGLTQELSMRTSNCQSSHSAKIGITIYEKEKRSHNSKQEEEEEEEGTCFPIQLIEEITGEEKIIRIKPYNLNIYPSKLLVLQREQALNAISYSHDGTIRLPHDALLNHCLQLSRWHCNIISGYCYFPNDYASFQQLQTNHHPALVKISSVMYSLWNVKPSCMGRHGKFSILDLTIMELMKSNDYIVQQFGRKSKWKVDGLSGELIVRNYVQFMKAWEKERINGRFWITGISYRTGHVIVKVNGDTNDLDLGHVYIVKSNNSHRSENLPSTSSSNLPRLCHATILPLYDFLVCDEVCCIDIPQPRCIGERTKSILKTHVQIVLNQRKIITKGRSSAQGLWDAEPPQLPTLSDDNELLSWSSTSLGFETFLESNTAIEESTHQKKKTTKEDQKETFNVTKKQKNLTLKITKLIKKKGILNGPFKSRYSREIYNVLLFRRFGYTREENPDRLCTVLINNQVTNIFTFYDELTYDLDEVLNELFIHIKQHHGAPPMIMLDDLSLIKPLQYVLDCSLKSVGFDEHIQVNWYPPPSKEETRFISAMSDKLV